MKPLVFAGPCGVLPMAQMMGEVEFLSTFADDIDLVIRAGAYKGQLFPGRKMVNGNWTETAEEYVGLGDVGVDILEAVEDIHGIPTCSEIMNLEQIAVAAGLTWAQVGTRHMGNLPLLRSLRDWGGPILLKRGMGNTVIEWIGAAEHLLHGEHNANNVVLCERGVVTHDHTDPRIRWRPDLLAIPQVKTDYPGYKMIVDVAHSTGRRDLVIPIAKAAMACGADGIMVEVMADPTASMTDAAQTIDHDTFKQLVEAIT